MGRRNEKRQYGTVSHADCFPTESGLGSAPIVAAAAQTKDPVHQGLISSTGTFWDTVVVCALTGLTIVNSGGWEKGLAGVELTRYAFSAIPVLGPGLLTFGLFTFCIFHNFGLVLLRRRSD